VQPPLQERLHSHGWERHTVSLKCCVHRERAEMPRFLPPYRLDTNPNTIGQSGIMKMAGRDLHVGIEQPNPSIILNRCGWTTIDMIMIMTGTPTPMPRSIIMSFLLCRLSVTLVFEVAILASRRVIHKLAPLNPGPSATCSLIAVMSKR
jgi:hypothetical protein